MNSNWKVSPVRHCHWNRNVTKPRPQEALTTINLKDLTFDLNGVQWGGGDPRQPSWMPPFCLNYLSADWGPTIATRPTRLRTPWDSSGMKSLTSSMTSILSKTWSVNDECIQKGDNTLWAKIPGPFWQLAFHNTDPPFIAAVRRYAVFCCSYVEHRILFFLMYFHLYT